MKALIVGAGAQGRVILDILRAENKYHSIGFVDDKQELWGKAVNGATIECGFEEAIGKPDGLEMIVALGNPDLRVALSERIRRAGVTLLNAVHPSAVVMPSACLGEGMMVAATAVVNSNARVGDAVIINTGAVVEHDCQLAAGSAVSPGAHLAGRVSLGACAFIATGAIVLSRLSVGARSVVGAGSLVTKDLPERVLAMGSPARICKELNEDFEWSRVL
jgi:UDP-perosamine 4-acetyltransferase